MGSQISSEELIQTPGYQMYYMTNADMMVFPTYNTFSPFYYIHIINCFFRCYLGLITYEHDYSFKLVTIYCYHIY